MASSPPATKGSGLPLGATAVVSALGTVDRRLGRPAASASPARARPKLPVRRGEPVDDIAGRLMDAIVENAAITGVTLPAEYRCAGNGVERPLLELLLVLSRFPGSELQHARSVERAAGDRVTAAAVKAMVLRMLPAAAKAVEDVLGARKTEGMEAFIDEHYDTLVQAVVLRTGAAGDAITFGWVGLDRVYINMVAPQDLVLALEAATIIVADKRTIAADKRTIAARERTIAALFRARRRQGLRCTSTGRGCGVR